jgi:C-terminal processing protease CtpA/Prc
MTTRRYDYGAVYFVKRSYIFGANWRDLTNEERAALQSNSGVYIVSVVNDTPAFRSDVLAGDILVKIDGQVIYGQKAASDALSHKHGQDVALTLFRNGQFIEKTVRLAQ